MDDLLVFRLYPITRSVYRQVVNVLWALGVATLGSPTLFDFISLLLRVIPLSTRMVMTLLITLAHIYGIRGYLCLDNVVIEKRFSKRCPWTGWTFSSSKGRKVYGLHIVVLLWCTGPVKIPVTFRLWRPQRFQMGY